jgi:hypothetical protein
MNRIDRSKAARLESILAKHAAVEVRVLADLRIAGFKFRSVEQAYKRLKAQRALAGFSQAQIDLVETVYNKETRK